jgi:hypothetical protein
VIHALQYFRWDIAVLVVLLLVVLPPLSREVHASRWWRIGKGW